jgi:hypothetical protein
MGSLLLAHPLYHTVPAPFFVRWINMDRSPVVGVITVNGAYITTSCEVIVREALKLVGAEPSCPVQGGPIHYLDAPTIGQAAGNGHATGEPDAGQPPRADEPQVEVEAAPRVEWDRLVILEHDVLPPLDALVRMACYSPEQDIVSAMVFEHNAPYPAMAFIEDADGHVDPITPETVRAWVADPMLYRVDACSFSMISIARHVLEDWPADEPMFGIDHHVGSHDLWFCGKARKRGCKVYVDPAVLCEHMTSVPIGYAHNQSAPMPANVVVREFALADK